MIRIIKDWLAERELQQLTAGAADVQNKVDQNLNEWKQIKMDGEVVAARARGSRNGDRATGDLF